MALELGLYVVCSVFAPNRGRRRRSTEAPLASYASPRVKDHRDAADALGAAIGAASMADVAC